MRMLALIVAICLLFNVLGGEPKNGVSQLDALIEQIETAKREHGSNEEGDRLISQLRQLRGMVNGDTSLVRRGMQAAKQDIKTFLKSPAACMVRPEDVNLVKSYEDVVERILSGTAPVESLLKFQDHVSHDQLLGSVDISRLVRGDLVFVRNNSVWTKFLVEASTREKRFSHIGIVKDCKGHVRLITVGADEITGKGCVREREYGGLNKVALDLAVYRYTGPDAEKVRERIARAAEKRIGTPFDPAFDLKTKDRLYCTEMVRDCVNEAAGHEVIGTSRKGDFEYVAVDDCYRNEMTKVWDCRDQKPEEKQPIQKLQSRPVVIKSSSTTNAPVRRIIRFVPRK